MPKHKQRPRGKQRHLCATKYCRNEKAKGRSICHKCYQRQWRAKHPLVAAWHHLLDHARQRKIEVTLTRAEFEAWVVAEGVFVDGKRNPNLHMDRREAWRGYSLDNIQALPCGENIAKGNRERHAPEYKSKRWAQQPQQEPDPF
jgi:hypothetical protein